MKKKLIISCLCILLLIISAFIFIWIYKHFITKTTNTIARINDEFITENDLKEMQKEYPNFEKENLLKDLIAEKLTLHEADKLGITVTDSEVEESIAMLNEMGDIVVNSVVEKYGSIENYKAPLKNRLVYEKIKELQKENFKSFVKYNENSIIKDVEKYINQQENKNISKTDKDNIIEQLKNNYYDSLFNVYFEIWKYKLINNADVEIFENFAENKERKISDITIEDIPLFFKAYFNIFSDKLLSEYEIVSLKSASIENYYDRYLYIKAKNKNDNHIVEITFDLNRENKEQPIETMKKNIKINGINGIIEENSNILNISLFDSNLNANINVVTDNLNDEEVINYLKNFIRICYT